MKRMHSGMQLGMARMEGGTPPFILRAAHTMSITALGGSSKPQTPELPAAEAHLGYRGEGLLDEVALLGGRHATLRWAVSGRRRNGTMRARGDGHGTVFSAAS